MLKLAERKLRCRWECKERERNADRAAEASGVGRDAYRPRQRAGLELPTRFVWNNDDEDSLLRCADCATNGVTFLAIK